MTFAEATKVTQVDSHTYTIDLSPEWVIGTVPHGGYITSCFQCVVRKYFDTTLREQKQPHTITLHLEFLRRTQVGTGTFKVKDVKLGRHTSVVHVALYQDGREEVIGYITNSNMISEAGVNYPTGWELKPEPLPVSDFSVLATDQDPNWGERKIWPSEELRKAPKNMRSWFPRQGQPSPACLHMWYCFRDADSRFTNESLGYVIDSFPQIIEYWLSGGVDTYSIEFEQKYGQEEQKKINDSKSPMWYPTVLLNMDVKKALPEEGVQWLFVTLQAKQIRNGRYDLEVMAFDQDMDLVAISNHVCFAVSAERNLAARRKVEGGSSKL